MIPVNSDLTITTRHSFGGHEFERTQYIRPDRSREEHRPSEGHQRADGAIVHVYGPRLAVIRRCDLGTMFMLNLDDREFESGKLSGHPTPEELEALRAAAPPVEPPQPTVLVKITTFDTGERKEAFGFTARRVITTREHIPLSGATSQPGETKTDGWYVDLDPTISCERWWTSDRQRGHTFMSARREGELPDVPQFEDIGAPETGYAIESESVTISQITLPDGATKEFSRSSTIRVTTLSTEPLDPALFEVPTEFRRVDAVRHYPTAPLLTRWRRRAQHLWRHRGS